MSIDTGPPHPQLPTESMRVKYHAQNPVTRRLVQGFLDTFDRFSSWVTARRTLEVGCGEGFLTDRLQDQKTDTWVCGLDASRPILDVATQHFGSLPFLCASAYAVPFADRSFDLVVGCEVLEHVEDPDRALAEVARVSGRYAILSVPREPLWRVLNVARGKYVAARGNTPGHLQHWSTTGFVELANRYFDVIDVATPIPWTMLLAERHRQTT